MPESLGIRVTTSNGRNDWSAIEKRTKGFIKPKDEDIIKNTTFSLDFHPWYSFSVINGKRHLAVYGCRRSEPRHF